MECNKDEALRAKEFAELKFTERDVSGALRFALKAQTLDPELDGLPQLLTTLHVHTSAQKGTNGETDYYKVLSTEPLADKDTIRKKYKRLALSLHPDKNKSVGADAAFQIVNEAWTLLSDKDKRFLYDQRRSLGYMLERVPDGNFSAATSQNGFHTSSNYNHSNGRDQWSATYTDHVTAMSQNGFHTFSNCNHPNGRDQRSASYHIRATSQNGLYTSSNYNHSNGRDQKSATHTEHVTAMSQNDFHTPSNDSRSNRRDQKGATSVEPSVEPTTPVCRNDFHTSSNDNRSNRRDQRSATHTNSIRPPSPPKLTFWTVCSSCKMQFEYLWTYLNQYLLCHNCRQRFLASETPAPKMPNGRSTPWVSYFQRKGSRQHNRTMNTCAPGSSQTATINVKLAGNSGVDTSTKKFPAGKFFKPASFESGQLRGSCAGQTASDVRPGFGELKRGHEEVVLNKEAHKWNHEACKKTDAALASGSLGAASSSVPKERPKKKRHLSRQEMGTQMGIANGGVAMKSVFGLYKGSVGTGRFDVAAVDSVLIEMAKKEISQKLKVWKEAAAPKTSFTSKNADNNQVKEKQKEEAGLRGVKISVAGCRAFVNPKKSSLANSHVDADVKEANTVAMTVPDPDFHDFDKDRTEKSFGSNQVWAVYDEDDGMPRYYAMVHSVISLKPFKLSMSWLNSKSNIEIAPLDWIACGFSKTSGELRIGKHVVYKNLPSFSHKVVRWRKGKRGVVCIYPTKGEVWALYRNWSAVWNEHTPDDVIQKYDMVQVLNDYNEEQGVKIVPLVKVAGFKTVFRQHWDQSKIMKIPREELFRFSHQVPSIILTGNEGHNAPKGCLELDPAATPLELLQVESEEYEDDMEVTGEGCNCEDPVRLSKTTKEEALVDNGKVTTETGLIEEAEKKDLADMMKREKEHQGPTLLVYSRKCFREDKKKGADC
ncbi:hypothetical protein D8674_029394 [Pyrus ussuriensis x Pyrus communis]|uniref:J domain-containing protein n=1 Tax=Pyrus ussuriensis x Pyrus communis TaxID=2448454 RepID=A0A5N5I1X8_9ROSA|nr:hypothetical protein D8674_029394 [Pyrus ussuriensis x Pyrus communis]